MYLQILRWYFPPPLNTTVGRGKLSFRMARFLSCSPLYEVVSLGNFNLMHVSSMGNDAWAGPWSYVLCPTFQAALKSSASPGFRKPQNKCQLWCWSVTQGSFFHIALYISVDSLILLSFSNFFLKFYSSILAALISGCLF